MNNAGMVEINNSENSRIKEFDFFIKRRVLPLGLFVQLTGMLWLGSHEVYVMLTYIYCFVPALISLLIHLYRFGSLACFRGMTTGEKLIAFLFTWIIANYYIVGSAGVDFDVVLFRLVTIVLYLYVVRTVVLYVDNLAKLFFLSACVATLYAVLTLLYQYVLLGQSIGFRFLGGQGYRVGSLGIEEFAYLVSPILAALYYGVFAAALFGVLVHGQYKSLGKSCVIILAVFIILVFIVLSGSRGPLLAYAGMLGVGLLLSNSPKRIKLILVLLVVVSALVFIFHQKIVGLVVNAFFDGFNGRFTIWEATIDYIKQSPHIGYGSLAEYPGPIIEGRIMKHPHSMILGITFYWGIPAALIYIAIFTWSVMTAYSHRDELHMTIAGCILVFGFIGMLTDTYNLLTRPGLEWLLFFFPVALCVSKKRFLAK